LEGGVGSLGLVVYQRLVAIGCGPCGLAFAPRPRQPFSILPLLQSPRVGIQTPHLPDRLGASVPMLPRVCVGTLLGSCALKQLLGMWFGLTCPTLLSLRLRIIMRVSNPHFKGYQLSKLLQSMFYGSAPLSGELSPVVCVRLAVALNPSLIAYFRLALSLLSARLQNPIGLSHLPSR